MGKLSEVREVRRKLRDKCPTFTLEDYCPLTSRTTVGSDNFFNFNQFPHLRNLNFKAFALSGRQSCLLF